MATSYTAVHRRQSEEGAWAAVYGCTAVATMVAMDQGTRGVKGPTITADDFRARQPDQVGGIDLYDAKIAARSWGVMFEVWASYYPPKGFESLRDHGRATFAQLVSLGMSGRTLVVQGDHDTLPPYLRCAAFLGDHAVEVKRRTLLTTGPIWTVSNPLCSGYTHWTDTQMRDYTGKLAGAGYAFVAAGPVTPPLRLGGIRRPPLGLPIRAWWAYERTGDTTWRRTRKWTGGFTSAVSKPAEYVVLGKTRTMTRLLPGGPSEGYDGYWIDLDDDNAHYREVE